MHQGIELGSCSAEVRLEAVVALLNLGRKGQNASWGVGSR